MKQVPYTISKTGKPINNQQDLIDDLVIALGLIEKGDKTQREKGAKYG